MDFVIFLMFHSLYMQTVVESVPVLETQATGSGVFENAKKNKRLSGFLKETRHIRNRSKCAMICHGTPICLSINFCGRDTCELSTEDIFSTTDGETLLMDDDRCTYVGMHRSEVPICMENNVFVDIRDDTYNGICSINWKRVDLEWSQWSGNILAADDSVEFKRVQNRSPEVEVAHGGVAAGDDEKVSFYYCFFYEG